MDVQEILARATETAQVQRVFGEPIDRDGVVVVPVAVVRGGAGGGSGSSPREEDGGEGGGAGYGFIARPAGVYVIKDGDAHWRPALDVGRVILSGQAVALATLLVLRSLLRGRSSSWTEVGSPGSRPGVRRGREDWRRRHGGLRGLRQ